MKKILNIFAVLVIFLFSSFALAFELPKHSFEIGPEIAYMKYKEPDVMQQDGPMYGLVASYAYRNRIMMGIDARYSYSKMDYENSGTINGINNYIFETRGLIGYEIPLSNTIITPYVGLAYRWLYDDKGGSVSSTRAAGFDRESNYYYSPIGIKTNSEIGNGWSLEITAEFDYFWGGEQNSYLSDVSPIYYSDVSNTQNDGYGVRGSIRFQKKWVPSSFVFEPFIRYWEIDKSEYNYVLYRGAPNTAVYEPKNTTIEIGAMFLFYF